MRALANTRVSVLRGDSVSLFDDPTDAGTVVQVGVPMAITETGRQTTKPSDDRTKTVLGYTARCSPRVDVRQGDRLLDQDGVTYYNVTAATTPPSTISPSDRRLDLERVPTTS